MVFYHGTSKQCWEKIQKEKVLWGVHSYRYTYLTPDKEIAKKYGDILLAVDYTPNGIDDNYGFNPPPGQICWQFSVFIPISIERVNRI